MNKNEIREKAVKVLEKEVLFRKLSNINDDSSLRTELGIDSLNFLKYLTALEKEFRITIDDEYWDYKLMNSINSITKYFFNRLQGEKNADI